MKNSLNLSTLSFRGRLNKMNFLEIENRSVLKEALALFKSSNLELEDCYNLAFYQEANIDEFASFDKKIIKFLK